MISDKNNSDDFMNATAFVVKRIIGPSFLVVGLILTGFVLESEKTIAFDLLNGDIDATTGFRAIKIFAPLFVAVAGLMLMRIKGFGHGPKRK